MHETSSGNIHVATGAGIPLLACFSELGHEVITCHIDVAAASLILSVCSLGGAYISPVSYHAEDM
jgi:hypothetical protein